MDAIVEHLDISAIKATYKGGGASSFDPRMLLKVILYAYLQNILAQMDEKGISDKKLRKGVTKIKEEFTAIAVAHNIRKMIAKGYCVCSKVAVG